jgi:TolB protein
MTRLPIKFKPSCTTYLLGSLGCGLLLVGFLAIGFLTVWRQFPALEQRPISVTNLPQPRETISLIPSVSFPTTTPELVATSRSTGTPSPPLPGTIVFACFMEGFDEICKIDPNTGEVLRLTNVRATDFYPSLSPDGERVVFSSRRDGRFEIYVMEEDGGDQFRLTDNLGSAFAPAFSPDNQWIAFTNVVDGVQSIWLMRVDGSKPRPITDHAGDDIDPSWSPDGQKILFASNRAGATQLFTVDNSTLEINQVTQTSEEIGGRNDWSPDGQTLAFYAGPSNDRNIYLVDQEGTNLRRITNGGDNLAPSFSPDGLWIVFTSFRNGKNELFRMRLDGSDVTQLTFDLNSSWQPRWGP